MKDVLTPHQLEVATRVLAEEGARRRHLVVSLSGAHAYGFPSPDSDLDLKAIHIEPTARLLGLASPKASADRLEVIDGIEIDYTSNEIQPVLVGILGGNGNYAERVLGSLAFERAAELASLAELVSRALSRRLHRHYRGFATSQLEAVESAETVPAKRVLYVLRTTLTGAHALATGRLVADVTELIDAYGFGDARSLIEAKRAGERAPLPAAEVARWRGELGRAFEVLDGAAERSVLPSEPANRGELEAWLLELRRSSL